MAVRTTAMRLDSAGSEGVSSDSFSKAAIDLARFGLTPNQAKVYLVLTMLGQSTARNVYESLHIHKVDAYRSLHELVKAGIVETRLGLPHEYAAIDPALALSVLLHKKEDEINTSRGHLNVVASEMAALREVERGNGVHHGNHEPTQMFRLGVGRDASHAEWIKLVDGASFDILRVSGAAYKMPYSRGMVEAYGRAKRRGVSIRIIAPMSPANRAYLKKISRIVSVRRMDGIQLRMGTVDRRRTLIHAGFTSGLSRVDPEKNTFLLIDNETFSAGFATHFERIWELARPLRL